MKESILELNKGCFLCLLSIEEALTENGKEVKILTVSDSKKIYRAYDDFTGICLKDNKKYHDYSACQNEPTIIRAIIQSSDEGSPAQYFINSIFFVGNNTDGYSLSDFITQREQPKERNMRNYLSDVGAEAISVPVMILKKEEKQGKNNNTYYEFTITDKRITIVAKCFDVTAKSFDEGCVVKCQMLKNAYGFKIDSMLECLDFTPNDFVKHPPITEEEMFDFIVGKLKEYSSGEKSISMLAVTLYENNKEKLLYWSAAISMHHNCYGGLLYHTYRMLQLSEKMCEVYSTLNKELLIVATALHDIGKLTEYNTDKTGLSTQTEKGLMLGHALIGINMIDSTAKEMGINKEDEMLTLLEHCIASHHGTLEFGAITLPQIAEAQILNLVDLTDSRYYMFEAAYDELKPGESMTKTHFGLGSKVHRPQFTEGEVFLKDYTD